jgi:DNA-binding transcriptional ArsR family regulator
VRDLLNITRALGDPTRLRLLLALRGGELCVCQLTDLCKLAPSTVSKHLSILAHAGLVLSRKAERWVYYRLPAPQEVPVVVREALDWVKKSLARSDQALADARQLRRIRKADLAVLCARVNR